MKKSILCFLFFVLAIGFYSAKAQDGVHWYDMGGYHFNGGFSVGYRNTGISSTDGSTDYYANQRYYEAYNLRNGISVTDLNLYGESKDRNGFFDELYLNASGINDPYTSVGFQLRTLNSYDLKVNYHRSEYYANRPDSLWSDLHKFDYSRQILNASLTYDISKMLDIEIDYAGTGRSGNEIITATPYYYGVTGSDFKENNGTAAGTSNFGGYSTANIYWMNTPRNDWMNDIGGRLNLKFDSFGNTNIVLGGGYRGFSQDVTYTPYSLQSLYYFAGSGFGSNSPTLTANSNGIIGGNPRNESLYQFTWGDSRNTKTPYYFAQITSNPITWLSVNGDIRLEQSTATSANGGLQEGKMRALSSWYDSVAKKTVYGVLLQDTAKLQNYYATSTGAANMDFKRLMGSLLLTFRLNRQLQFTTKYKYTSDDEQSNSVIRLATSLNSDVTNHVYTNFHNDTTSSNIKYTSITHVISPQLVYSPLGNFNIRGGVTYLHRDPLYTLDTLAAAVPNQNLYRTNLSKKTTTLSPCFSIYYRPVEQVSLRSRYELTENSSKYDPSTLGLAQSGQYVGRAYGGTAPQYDLLTPDVKHSFDISADIQLTHNLLLSLGYKLETSKGNLQPWYDYYNSTLATTATPLRVTGDLNLKTNTSSLTGNVQYMFNDNTQIRLTAQYSMNKWSMPFTGTSKQSNTPGDTTGNPFNDLTTALIDQDIKDLYLDGSLMFKIIENLNVSVGLSMLSSTGGDLITPSTVAPTLKASVPTGSKDPNAPITNPAIPVTRPDMPWIGGPYSTLDLHASAKYKFTNNLGFKVDWQYVKLDESVEQSYVGLTSFTGNLFKISLLANL